MTPEQINRKIAEVCGWSAFGILQGKEYGYPPTPRTVGALKTKVPDPVPKYFGDLNAVHEAEKKLYWKEQGIYAQELIRITLDVKDDGTPATLHGCFIIANATTAQRC